jgi:AcrR family transcriptional regulator
MARPLDPTRDAAILQAALEGLAELGYDRLSMDEIAARARAGKGALYRRWSSKAELIVAAIVAWREQLAPIEIPDTGSLAGDFEALLALVPNFDEAARRQMGVLLGLAGAASRDPELREPMANDVLGRPRRVLSTVLQRAVQRGEIPPDVDLALIPDILVGLNAVKVMVGEFPDRDYVRRVLQDIIYPLVTGKRLTDS